MYLQCSIYVSKWTNGPTSELLLHISTLLHVDGVCNIVISNTEMMPDIFLDLYMLPVSMSSSAQSYYSSSLHREKKKKTRAQTVLC